MSSPESGRRATSHRSPIGWVSVTAIVVALLSTSLLGFSNSAGSTGQVPQVPMTSHVQPAHLTPATLVAPLSASGLETKYTLSVGNGTLLPGNVVYPSFGRPWYVAYVPSVNRLYLSVDCVVYLVNPSTLALEGQLSVGGCGLAYVPSSGNLYLSCYSAVCIVDPATDTLITKIPANQAGQTVFGVFVYDAAANAIVVGNVFNGTANVVNLSLGRVVANLSIGYNTVDAAYDSVNTNLYLADYENNAVEIVNSSTWHMTSDPLPTSLFGFMYGVTTDDRSGNVYVTSTFYCPGCYGTDWLVEISGVNGSILRSIGLGSYTTGLAYDSATNEVFVADSIHGYVYVVNADNLSIITTVRANVTSFLIVGPWWLTYVPQLGTVYAPTSYQNSLVAISGKTLKAYASTGGIAQPLPEAWDPACGCLVVGDYLIGRLYFVNGTTYRIVRTVGLGGWPRSIAYDNSTGQIWVTLGGLTGSLGVDVLDGTNGTLVTTLSPGAWPSSVTYDPQDQRMFVPILFTTTMDVYNSTNLSLVQQIAVGGQNFTESPGSQQLAWDSNNDHAYLSNWNGNDVSVLDARTGRVLANITHVPGPDSIVFDSATGKIYTADQNAANISIIDPVADSIMGNLSYQYPSSILPQPGSDLLFATNGSGELTVFNLTNGSTARIAAGSETLGLAWLPNGALAVSDGRGEIYFVSGPAPTPLTTPVLSIDPSYVRVGRVVNVSTKVSGGTGPLTYSYSGLPDNCPQVNRSAFSCAPSEPGIFFVSVTVRDSAGDSSTGFGTLWVEPVFQVIMAETGLPSGTRWWINVTGASSFTSTGPFITFPEVNGTYQFNVASANKSFASVGGSFLVEGSGAGALVNFSLVTFPVAFREMGLPPGTSWNVTIDRTVAESTSNAVVFYLPNGTYTFRVSGVPGWQLAGVSYSGNVTVNGTSPVAVALVFVRVVYDVTFHEAGLGPGTDWWVNLSSGQFFSSTVGVISFAEPNGTFAYTLATGNKSWAGHDGSISIDGSDMSVEVTFVPETYPVILLQSGLPSGVEWWVNITGHVPEGSTGGSITIALTNGTYGYAVGSTDKRFHATGGVVSVDGTVTGQQIVFSPVVYTIKFAEQGLPSGAPWNVTVQGVTAWSTGPTITLTETNGSYSFVDNGTGGYTSSPSHGVLVVNGTGLIETILFTAPAKGPADVLGLPPLEGYALLGSIAAAVVACTILAVVVSSRRKRRTIAPPVTGGDQHPPTPPT